MQQTLLETRPLDPTDEAQMRRFYEIARRAEQEDGRPWNSFWTYDELALVHLEPTDDVRHAGVCAFDGDEMVGAAAVSFSLLDNLDKGDVMVCVEPELRGRGIGSTLLDAAIELLRAEGRTEVLSWTSYPFEQREDAPVLRWANKRGFRLANTEVYRILRLPVADALLDEVATEAAARHGDYEIVSLVDDIPEELQPSYCHLVNQLVLDAPTGDVAFEEEQLTPEVLRDKIARNRRMGRTVYYTLAVRDGEAVAHSDLVVQPAGTHAHQWGTLVRRDHRGHRLGAAVKVANLRALQRDRPDIAEVHTGNAETNAFMVSINERLGFEAVALCPELLRVL